ncbi:hypothetical protein ACX0G9_03475 [Flavitalea flava]
MPFPTKTCLILTFCSLLFSFSVQSQGFRSQDSTVQQAKEYALTIYHNFLGEQSSVYNGIANISYDPATRGHAYFQIDSLVEGTIIYEGIQYRDMPLMYDLVLDQPILLNEGGYLIGLINRNVREFFLMGHHFINTGSGYIDLMSQGRLTLKAKRTKKIEESIEGMTLIHTIVPKDYFYVVKDSVTTEISNQRSLLALMADKKKEVKQFIRANKIKFRKDRENAIVSITGYYNQLSK